MEGARSWHLGFQERGQGLNGAMEPHPARSWPQREAKWLGGLSGARFSQMPPNWLLDGPKIVSSDAFVRAQ